MLTILGNAVYIKFFTYANISNNLKMQKDFIKSNSNSFSIFALKKHTCNIDLMYHNNHA